MAIAFARITYHSRSQGHSAVAGAAYRAGVLLKDERTGEIHNFKNRSDVLYSEILLPEGASEIFKDREILWNAVEAAETRKNSQIAKDVVLALPRDLDLASQIDLARNFTQYHFVRHGLVADIAIHNHSDGNPHAHIYVSTRRLKSDHFDKYKARDLEPGVARGRVVDPQYWGEQWRDFQNNYFIEQGIKLVVDANHIISQRHEGRIRDQRSHYLKEENQLRRQASIDISLNDPAALLNLLGSKHAVFNDRDIALLINKNTLTREEYETALLKLKAHPDLIFLGVGDDGRNCYTTRANYHCEATMAKQASVLNRQRNHAVSANLAQQASRDFNLNEEQSEALLYVANSGDISAVVGRAGTGKSYLMRAARQMWEASGYRIYGMVFSGVASKSLEAYSGISSRTICSLKMQVALGKFEIGSSDILVMDEAGMTDLYDLARVVHITQASGAKLVLIGDTAQLQPIGPGAPFRAITEQIGFAELDQIQRQDSQGDCAASRYLSQGYVDKAIDHYALQQQVHLISQEENDEEGEGGNVGGQSVQLRLVVDWGRELTSETVSSRLILAHRNADVTALNQIARRRMQEQELLGIDSCIVETTQGSIALALGDRILFLRNDKQLGVSNGEFATIASFSGDKISVRVGNQQTREVIFSINEYRDFNYGYAATVHKSQGATYDHVFVYISGHYWDRFLTYVAMTRHRKTLNVYADKSQFKDLDALKKFLSRAVLKDSVLDWPLSFAIRRGFDPDRIMGWFIDKALGIKQVIHDSWLFVVNYAAFQRKKYYRNLLQSKIKQRELAKKVALFVDSRNGLSKQIRQMRRDLTDGKKLYDHPDYAAWYEQTLFRNQLAFEIKQDYALFEQALTLNRIGNEVIERLAGRHECAIRVESYLIQCNKVPSFIRYELAEKINADFVNHFSAIRYFSKKERLSTKAFIERIKTDIKPFDRTYDYEDEWEHLAAIKSVTVERVIMAKSRLDKANNSQSIAIQTRAFEKAVKALCYQEKLFSELKIRVPKLAKIFEKINNPVKAINIDWKSDKFNIEFDGLRKSSDAKLQYLVKFRDLLRNAKDKSQEKRLTQRLETLTVDIFKSKFSQVELKKLVPSLALKLEAFIQFKSQQKKHGRDL